MAKRVEERYRILRVTDARGPGDRQLSNIQTESCTMITGYEKKRLKNEKPGGTSALAISVERANARKGFEKQ